MMYYLVLLLLLQATTIEDTMWWNVVLRVSPNWTSQIGYETVASLQHTQSVCAVLLCFYTIITKCNEPLEAPHPLIDDDRYDVVCHLS